MSGAEPELESFETSLRELLEIPPSHDRRDLETVLGGLERFLAIRFPTLPASDAAEIASESLARLLVVNQEGRLDPARSPAPYLTRIAHNLAVSAMRRPTATNAELDEAQHALADDEIAALLDARASSEMIRGALVQAVRVGDHVLVRVVRVWLELAESQGSAPASREVAERLGLSHTTVGEALKRLEKYLPT